MDLSKLKYGIDYYALPPRTICWLNDDAMQFYIDSDKNTIKLNENDSEYQIYIVEESRNGFTYKLKNQLN